LTEEVRGHERNKRPQLQSEGIRIDRAAQADEQELGDADSQHVLRGIKNDANCGLASDERVNHRSRGA
jgi:hypothetical protein